jgi:hypothetical protein
MPGAAEELGAFEPTFGSESQDCLTLFTKVASVDQGGLDHGSTEWLGG